MNEKPAHVPLKPYKQKLSPAQVRVLRLLREEPREVSKSTHHNFISGACAQALMDRDFAARFIDTIESGARYKVKITEVGVHALLEHEGNK